MSHFWRDAGQSFESGFDTRYVQGADCCCSNAGQRMAKRRRAAVGQEERCGIECVRYIAALAWKGGVVAFVFGVWWCIRPAKCSAVHKQPLAPSRSSTRRCSFPILTRQQLLENLVTLLNLSKLVTIPSCFCSSLVPEPVEHADHVLKIICAHVRHPSV
jgi:hypothetical protein